MKKIIIVLLVLVNVLLFLSIREAYFENDFADMVQLHNAQPDIVHSALIISNPHDDLIGVETSDAIFEMFRYLSRRFDLMIMYGENFSEHNEYTTYLIANSPIDERLGLVTETSLDFFYDNTGYFYTNQRNVDSGINFFLLNNRITVNLFPITAMGIIRGGEYFVVARTQEELEESISIFMAEFGSYVDRRVDFGATTFGVEEVVDTFLLPTILILMLMIAIIIIIVIHSYSKKIAIYKTLGISVFHIAKQLFFPLIGLFILTIVAVNTVLFAAFVGVINIRTIPIIMTLVRSMTLQLIGVTVTIAVSCLLLLFIPTYSLLKNSNFSRLLMGANFVVKIAALIVMVALLSGRIDLIQNNFRVINHVRSLDENAGISNYEFSPMLNPRYRGDGYHSLLIDLFRRIDVQQNVDPNIIYEYEILYEYHRAYRLLNDAGAIFCYGTGEFGGLPSILTVNENYLAKHPVKDVYGNIVDLRQNTSDIIYLVPEIHLNSSFVQDLAALGYDIMVIGNEQTVIDYSLGWQLFDNISEQPYIINVFTDAAFFLDASPFSSVFIDADFNELMRDTIFYDKILISTVGSELRQIRERHIQETLEHIFVMVPIYALILVIIIQYSYLYSKVFNKRIYVQKTMGHNPFRIFAQMLFESCLAVLVVVSIGWYLQLDIRLLLMVLAMEVVVYLAVVAKPARKHSFGHNYY